MTGDAVSLARALYSEDGLLPLSESVSVSVSESDEREVLAVLAVPEDELLRDRRRGRCSCEGWRAPFVVSRMGSSGCRLAELTVSAM